MYALAASLNQSKRYPDVHFYFEQKADGRYIHYDNYDYFNDDGLKDYVLDMALEVYTEDELRDFYVTYKQRDVDIKRFIHQLIGFVPVSNMTRKMSVLRPSITWIERQNQ